jgi:hypothetical protein
MRQPRLHPCDPDIYDYGRRTRGFGALPAQLLALPSSSVRATGITFTSAVAVSKGHIGGTSDQSSFVDHAGEVGFPAFGQQNHLVSHFSINLVASNLLHLRCPRRSDLASRHVSFLHIYPSCGQLLSPCLTSGSSCAILSQTGLLEVPVTYLGSFGYYLARGLVLLNGCSSEKLMLTGGPECTTCLAWFRTLSECTLPP